MAASDQVVDISEDTKAIRRRWRRALFRIGVPIVAISLVIAAILGIAVYSHYANRAGILALSDDLLNTMDAQIAQRVAAYLDPCERTLRVMAEIDGGTSRTDRNAGVERFATSALKEIPQIAAFYNGDGGGNFVMVRRQEGGGVQVKKIVNDAAGRRVTLIDRDAAGNEKQRRQDPTDTFDPRTRPWYEGASKASGIFWTGIYIFFSDHKPGITVSLRSQGSEDPSRVFGVDITLEELSRFLDSLEIGNSGHALIIDGDGGLIAAPHSMPVIKSVGANLVRSRIDELGDPVLTSAFDRFRIEGKGRRTLEKNGVKYLTSTMPLPGSGRDWWVLMVVPEDDFIGFAADNNRTALKMSVVIIIAVVALAVLLVQQGFRSDRMTRLMVERGRAMAQQSAAYAAISEQIGAAPAEAPPALTESLTAMTGALRASVWSLTMRGHVLHCIDSYDRNSQGHVNGFELHDRELPGFFELLRQGDVVSVGDASVDRRTAQFYNVMMLPLGSRALTMIPVRRGEQISGVICLEESNAMTGPHDFLRTVTSMVSPVLTTSEVESDPLPGILTPSENASPIGNGKISEEILSADLCLSPADLAALDASHFTKVAVMVLRLSGAVALAKKTSESDLGAAARIAAVLQNAAAEYGIGYLKFVGQQAIAASGLREDDEDPMARIGAFAISVREHLSSFVDAGGESIEFRIGLGYGSCFGCGIGQEVRQFNLWGDAIQVADVMATSVTAGAIQASEAAYTRLRENFLFRPRGSFYTPGIGESRTFVLAGQL